MLGSRRSTITDYSRLSVNMCWTVVVAQPFFKWRSNIFCSDGNEIWESHLADPKKCNSSLYLPPQSARKCPAEVWQIVSLHLRPFYLAIHCDLGSLGGSRFWGQPLHSSRSFFRMPSWGLIGTLAQGLHITKQSSGQCNGFSFSRGTTARCLPLRLKRHRENDQPPEITSNEPEV